LYRLWIKIPIFVADVTIVGSAKEALKLLHEDKSRYSVVISDIKMPEMDGIELLQEIMADSELRQTPVISTLLQLIYYDPR